MYRYQYCTGTTGSVLCTVYSNIADPRNFIWIRIDEPIFKKLLTNLTLELFLSFSPLPELFLLFTSVYLRFIPPPPPPPIPSPRGNSENVYMKLGSPVPAGYVYCIYTEYTNPKGVLWSPQLTWNRWKNYPLSKYYIGLYLNIFKNILFLQYRNICVRQQTQTNVCFVYDGACAVPHAHEF